jgi:class 3 adenylate cyclase
VRDTARAQIETGEERKLVAVLFVDLVGFTRRSDGAIRRDGRALLRPYHDAARREIERIGGTVENFVGDAVMAVFKRSSSAPAWAPARRSDREKHQRAAASIEEARARTRAARRGPVPRSPRQERGGGDPVRHGR